MRALYYPFSNELNSQSLLIEGDAAHHLNVVRVKNGEQVLVLNGRGTTLKTTISSVAKKQIELSINETQTHQRSQEITLAVACPKKDAFEDILKMATELGVKTIAPLSSQFSQYDFVMNERTERLLESALIQSNNPWMPEILPQQTLSSFLSSSAQPLYFFNSRPSESALPELIIRSPFAILIGPEGGFHQNEIQQIQSTAHTAGIHLPTPLLRAPTAVSAAIGYLLALSKQ